MGARRIACHARTMERDDRRDSRQSKVDAWLLIGSGVLVVLLIVLL